MATNWLTKYGEPIDCYELKKHASLASVESERTAVAALRLLAAYSELLGRQSAEQRKFFERRVPGGPARFDEHLDALISAAGANDLNRRKARLERLLTAVEGRDRRRSALAVSRSAHPGELLYVLQFAQRHATAQAAELANTAFRRVPDWRWMAKTRGADVALAHAAYEVSEWIRARHCNRSNKADGNTSWRDVVRCFQWYGHDLSHIAGHKADALRRLATRIHAKRSAAEKAATKATKKKPKN